MVQLFDAIAEHVGNRQRIPTAKVHALKEAFKLGCEDDKTDTEEKDAIGAFLRVLDAIMGDQVTVTRSEWVDYVPAKNAYTPKEVEVLNEILRNVLDSPEARSGLFAEMDGEEGEEEDGNTLHNAELYVRVMTLLFDRVLDPKQTGQVVEKRVNALGKALKEGCDEADEDEEVSAMDAFLKVLDQMMADGKPCSREKWVNFMPAPNSYTAAQESTAMSILETVLKEEDPTEGLKEVIDEIEAGAVAE